MSTLRRAIALMDAAVAHDASITGAGAAQEAWKLLKAEMAAHDNAAHPLRVTKVPHANPITTQAEADAIVPVLLSVASSVTFLEVTIAPTERIDLFRVASTGRNTDRNHIRYTDALKGFTYDGAYDHDDPSAYTKHGKLNTVRIRGGKEPMLPAHVKLLEAQCRRTNATYVFEGWGDWTPVEEGQPGDVWLLGSGGRQPWKEGDKASPPGRWSEFGDVLIRPSDKRGPSADYATPAQVALRTAEGASVCCDPDCDLSGGYAHAGPCEPCQCGKEHAIAECPARST